MGRIVKMLVGRHRNKAIYFLSDDFTSACNFFSDLAASATDERIVFYANIASALIGGAYLEARMNEEIANRAAGPARGDRRMHRFWVALHDAQKDLDAKEKWNFVASISGGKLWDASRAPFQAYDLVLGLRNELAHYKGIISATNEPPIRKLTTLLGKYKGTRSPMFTAFRVASWADELLSGPQLASWIADAVGDLHRDFEFYLTGKRRKTIRVPKSAFKKFKPK